MPVVKEKAVKREVGLWIDHRKTVIVTFVNGSEITKEIRSNIASHARISDGSHPNAPTHSEQEMAEDTRDRRFTNHLGRYYEGVILSIRDADAIWIFGPGEAKVELGQQLEREHLGRRIVGIETVDKMTARQISARVRKHYLV
jgi:hypothetical protein